MMAMTETRIVYICPHCMHCEESAGPCGRCGTVVVECEAGPTDDRMRRPIIDQRGNVRTRAPQWWLRKRVGKLVKYFE